MNGDATAAALADAAREIFARHGYNGASVRAITAAAGANLGAITYHYGSKRELYDRVVASIVAPLAERVERVVAGGGSTVQRAGDVVTAYFEHLAANPDLPQFMLQELAMSGEPPAAVAEPMSRIHAALTRLVEEGQARGELCGGPAPVMSLFILSVPVHLALVRRALGVLRGVDLSNAAAMAEVVAAARRFVETGLRSEVRQ